jgi:acetoin utilization deacetylase AcuC-like enzyme
MPWFYDDRYDYGRGLPGSPTDVHGFVLRKPSQIRERLVAADVVRADAFHPVEAVTEQDLTRVHDVGVIAGLRDVGVIAAAIELEAIASLPPDMVWEAVVRPQLVAAGGTYLALRAAATGEWAFNLSGGFHHARRNLSHGFCLINDIAVGLARLRHDGVHRRALIVDLDLHQGDGNAAIFAEDRDVYTVSVHEEDLFPIPKMTSNLDVGLPSSTGDHDYLAAVDDALTHARACFDPDLVIYVAGSDPLAGDPLGTLEVSRDGLLARDRQVGALARELGCPLVALPAGGYSHDSAAATAAGFQAMVQEQRQPQEDRR